MGTKPHAVVAVIDDDPGTRKATGRLLRAHGFHAECLTSAEAFLAWEGPDPACLVLDVQLGGMSGIELGRYLQALGSRLPIIFITARTDESTRQRAMEAGCVAYLRKPFQSCSLVNAITMALRE
jgi:FixJ family two-component response regulator